ncbi:MAG: hypothetical protein LBP40_08290 [Campylobacteraceae bacterium]|jgi:hypothetical protein|nr:hypothetical protein [Campylobacteraceae bacterium]
MKYLFKTYTQDYRLGQIVELDDEDIRTQQLLAKGFIVPAEEPKETKVKEPKETKVKEPKETKVKEPKETK